MRFLCLNIGRKVAGTEYRSAKILISDSFPEGTVHLGFRKNPSAGERHGDDRARVAGRGVFYR